ncbi:uncharacterized protein LOC142222102 isoform X2 [Haematobia irritans]|uniref:uncharacterized protein LOC142222102 isoform X2 n=1 Tax=Haematobia irritans TaxID=7368 RepID=UPI003F506349
MLLSHWLIYSFALTISWFAPCKGNVDGGDGYSYNGIGSFVKSCPDDGVPICGARDADYFLFPNQCLFNAANKDVFLGGGNFNKMPLYRCIHGCRISCPKENNPVCGLNLHTRQKKLFRTLCDLTKFACESDMDWRVVKNGICDEDYSNSRLRLGPKSHKRHTIQKRSFDNSKGFSQNANKANNYKTQTSAEYKNPEDLHQYPNDGYASLPTITALSGDTTDEDIQKLLASQLTPDDLQYGTTVTKPMQYNEINDMAFNYLPTHVKSSPPDVSSSQSPKIHTFGQNSHRKGAFYYPYHNEPASYPTEKPTEFASSKNLEDLLNLMRSGNTENPKGDSYNQPTTKTNLNFMRSGNIENPKGDSYNHPTTKMNLNSMTSGNIENPKGDSYDQPTTKTNLNSMTSGNTESLKADSYNQPTKAKTKSKKLTECKYGVDPICGVLSNGTVRTFDNLCEMRSANLYLKNTWVKLHQGPCDKCKYNCSREYEPICVQRNGANYTMVNDCYYNMAICLDKISNWTKIDDGECQRTTQIVDKYANMKPGFMYTSSYFTDESTEKIQPSTTTKPSISQTNKNDNSKKTYDLESTTSAYSSESESDNEEEEEEDVYDFRTIEEKSHDKSNESKQT